MLKSKSVAKLIETTLNRNDKDEKFRVVYEVGSYKGNDINCILKQGKGTITPILNYTNVKTPFTINIIMPLHSGKERADVVIDIVNDLIQELNGQVKGIDGGRAVFLFNPLEVGEYESRATVGQSVLIKLDFFVEYSSNSGTKYEMALIDTQFDLDSQNTRRFESKSQQQEWYENKILDGAGFCEVLTPNINSLVITQQRYINIHNLQSSEILSKNYAIIKETIEDGNVNYFYYHITSINVDQYNIFVLDLKLDTLQTYYIDLQFGDCTITRAHLDRFVYNTDSSYKHLLRFDTRPESPLYEREDFKDVEKRLIKRDVIPAISQDETSTFGLWYKNMILGWLYVYIGDDAFTVGSVGQTAEASRDFSRLSYRAYDNRSEDAFYNTISCLCVPLYNTERRIIVPYDDDFITLDWKAIDEFIKRNASDNIYSVKFSILPPFDGHSYISGVSLDEYNNLKLSANKVQSGAIQILQPTDDAFNMVDIYGSPGSTETDVPQFGFFHVKSQASANIGKSHIYMNEDFEKIKKGDVIKSKKDPKWNPKLYSSDYMSLRLSDNSQNGADYDILKLGVPQSILLNYTEALTPDITKTYIRCINPDTSAPIYYIQDTMKNLTGFVGSDDKSLMVENDKYKSMIAQNKNFFLQNSVNNATQFIDRAIIGAGLSTISGSPLGAVSGVVGGISNLITNKINQNLTIDNLKNSPNSLSGARGNAIFNSLYSETGIVVEVYDILPFEKEIINDYMFMNGFTFNKVANIKDYDNKRKYFNYIEAKVENIVGNISNPIRDDIRQRFANGVRFWNVDEISYENENYERWLEA